MCAHSFTGYNFNQSWRNSEAMETEEIKNFSLIFAAMFEDLPQACINLAFLSHPSRYAPVCACVLCCVIYCGVL